MRQRKLKTKKNWKASSYTAAMSVPFYGIVHVHSQDTKKKINKNKNEKKKKEKRKEKENEKKYVR